MTINKFFTITLVISTIVLSGCSQFNQNWKIDTSITKKKLDNVKVGDIIITGKNWQNPISWFGHSAVMVNKYNVGEYPKLCSGYHETDIIVWLNNKKEFTIIRYKKFDKKFKKAFLRNWRNTKNKSYKIVDKTNSNAFYCSQYIWYLYWKSAKDLNYELDIDKDGGYLVTPYDLLNSKYFDKVNL